MDDFLVWGRLIAVALALVAWPLVMPAWRTFRNPFLLDAVLLRLLIFWVFLEAAIPETVWSPATKLRSGAYMVLLPGLIVAAVVYRRGAPKDSE